MVIDAENGIDFWFTSLCCILDLGFYMTSNDECRTCLGMTNLILGLEWKLKLRLMIKF